MLARLSKRFAKGPQAKNGWETKYTIDGATYYYHAESGEVTWDKPTDLMSDEEKEATAGDFVFIPHPQTVWQPAKVIKQNKDGGYEVRTFPDGKKATVYKGMMQDALTAGRKQEVALWEVKLSSLKRPSDDLVTLDSHNEAMIINNLQRRYEKDALYTWVGAARSVLVSVNPFKNIDGLYGQDVIDLHHKRPPNKPLPPHVYDIANDSYETMQFENKNQSVLISGESGAGKTVCTKQVLDFLASVAGSKGNLEEKILVANPLLEAFGNAQTIRNNNSSRFGKYIQVVFDNVEKEITSASITNYLLEKSRVVYQQANSKERNYHVFYQLCKKGKFGLGKPSEYNYLSQSGTYDAKDIDDLKEHDDVLDAMSKLDFTDSEIESVMQLTAGILQLGNIEFKPKVMPGHVQGSEIASSGALNEAAKHLGVDAGDLAKVCTSRSISVRGKRSVIPLDPSKARNGTDALAMGVYSRLFSFLVDRVNDALVGEENNGKYIGILDIFGFEIFENNSFEQLCINYCNEKLQQQFNQTTFKEEEALYIKEGINFTHVEFIDNQEVLDLIEGRPNGILLMVDDETIIPEGKDSKFMNKAETMYKKHPKFETDKHRKLKDSLSFEINHYAGVVCYNADGFVAKNLDTLFQDLYDLCASSKNEEMVKLFPAQEGRRKLVSLGKQFRGQLNDLMDSIHETESRYIRCIKPNAEQDANKFQASMVLDQLRYSGVFEAVDIRRQGFPFRLTYAQFACRYSCINRGHKYKKSTNPEARCKEILSTSKQDFSDVQFGKTLLLYRSKEFKVLQLLRNLALETLIPKAEAVMRGHLAREFYRRCKAAQAKIAKALRVGNDIAMLDEALEAVEPTIGTFRKLFDYQPTNLKAAKEHRKGLQKWLDLEKKLEKLVDQDPNKVYYELAEVVDEAKAHRDVFNFPTDRQNELINTAIDLRANSDLGKIDGETDDILHMLERDAMQEILDRADSYNHSTPTLKEIRRILNLPMIEFYALELEKAKELGDEPRRIAVEIALKELFLDQNGSKFKNLSTFEGLKDPTAYASATMFGKKKAAETMMVWKKKLVSSLTTVTSDSDDKATAKATNKAALLAFKNAKIYAGDAKPGKTTPEDAAAEFLSFGANSDPKMKDELYVQLLVQLKENPNPESAAKYFDLLLLTMASFAPSEDIERFTLIFLRSNAPSDCPAQKYASALHTVQYGSRPSPPSASSIDSKLSELKSSLGSRYSTKRERKAVEEEQEDEE